MKREARLRPSPALTSALVFFVVLLDLLCAPLPAARASHEDAPWRRPASITVVSDDNYPPYIFRTDEGRVQGILVDQWKAWEQATGVSVNLVAMDWESAQKYMLAGHADVIDTLFYSDARAKLYDFTKPHASLDVLVFFHKSLGGISDAQSLRGFTVGVKSGDAVIEVLGRYGIHSLKPYDSYKDIINAARAGDIRVFSMDAPPALYYLYKYNLESEFRQAFVLYSGAFHRAVKKGDRELLQLVEQGFVSIPAGVRQGIDEKWLGTPIVNRQNLHLALYLAGGIAVLVLALGAFNIILRRRVRGKTAELQNTLARLQTSEERFRTIFNSVSDLIFIHSWPDGRIVDVNQRTCDVFGYTREEMLRLSVESASVGLAPFDQVGAMDLMRKAYEGASQMVEWHARRRDGSLFWLEVSIRRALVLGREQILVSCRDISDRRKAEEALKASENTLRSLFASMTDIILILDAEGRYLEVAPTNTDRLYRPPPELLGRTVTELFAPDKAAYFLGVIRQCLSGGITVSTDYNLVIGDREYWFAGNVSPLSADRVLWVARDITERKTAEETLKENVVFLESLDRVDQAIRKASDLDQMMQDALDVILDVLDLDRVWLLYPLDLSAPVWRVPMERTRPGYPGALAQGTDMPMTAEVQEAIRPLLGTANPLSYGPGGDLPMPEKTNRPFAVKSQLLLALHPKFDKPWILGAHQCARVRHWTERDKALFTAMGGRIQDALNSLLFLRDLRQSEERYRVLYQNTPAMLHSMNREGRMAYVSDTWCAKLGYTREEVLGRSILDFLTKDSIVTALEVSWPQFYATGFVEDIPYRFVTKDGQILDILLSAKAERDADGAIARSLAVLTDVTEKKRAEESLRESEERYRSVIQNMLDVYYRTDAAGRLVMFSPSVLKVLGYDSLDEVLGRPTEDLYAVTCPPKPGPGIMLEFLTKEDGIWPGKDEHLNR